MDFVGQIYSEAKIKLNKQQKSAVFHEKGPALVLAGPGSGKTTVIICRLARLIIEKEILPDNIVSLTFNRAAAIEMEQRFNRTFGHISGGKVRFSTLHAFSYSIIKWYEKYRGIRLELIEGSDQKSKKSLILKELFQKINRSPITEDELDTIVNEVGIVKNGMIKDLERFKSKVKNFASIYSEYERYKKEKRLIDFDDMLVYSLVILRRYPDLLNRYRKRYKFIQVDEGQDMSKIQFEIVKLLAEPMNNLFIVADDDQSIYGFRGAEPKYILDFGENFEGARVYLLEQNYRSSSNIVEFTSNFIKANKNRYDKNHRTSNGSNSDPLIVKVEDPKAQVQFLIDEIKSITSKNGTAVSSLSSTAQSQKLSDSEPKKTIAILYRNNISSILVAEMFERSGLGFNLREKGNFFFSHWFVLDILAFMNVALSPWDTESFLRICFKINRYISKEMAEYVVTQGNSGNLFERLLKYEGLSQIQKQNVRRVQKEFRKLSKMRPLNFLEFIDREFDFLLSAKRQCERTGSSYSYVQTLFNILKCIAADFNSIIAFQTRISYMKELFEKGTGKEKNLPITFSTVHASKGLEYDHVYMIDLYDGEFPNLQSIEFADNGICTLMEEERRLFYVGMTRARETVSLLWPQYINGELSKRSKFIDEIENYIHIKLANKIKKGVTVHHKRYGYGTVIEKQIEQDENIVIRVDFSGKKRLLDLNVCIEKGILRA